MASARSCSGRAPPDPPGPAGSRPGCSGRWRRRGDPGRKPPHRWPAPVLQRPGPRRIPRSRRISGQVVQDGGDVGVIRAVNGLIDAQRPFLQRPGLRQIPQVMQDLGQVVQVAGDGGVIRAVNRLIDAQRPLLPAAGPPPDPPGPAGLWPGCSGRWRRRGDPGRKRPHRCPAPVPAAAGPAQLPQVPQDRGQIIQVGGDVGVIRAVGGLADGQGPF